MSRIIRTLPRIVRVTVPEDTRSCSTKMGVYGDAEAEEDTGASLDPEAGRGEPSTSRRGTGNACESFVENSVK